MAMLLLNGVAIHESAAEKVISAILRDLARCAGQFAPAVPSEVMMETVSLSWFCRRTENDLLSWSCVLVVPAPGMSLTCVRLPDGHGFTRVFPLLGI